MVARRRFLCSAWVVVTAIALGSRLAAAQAAVDSTSPAAVKAGRDVYHGAGTCQVCHGANLEGVVGPSLKGSAWKDAKGGGYDAILNVVMKGVPGTAMVGHQGGISDDDARKVSAYIWAVSHGKASP